MSGDKKSQEKVEGGLFQAILSRGMEAFGEHIAELLTILGFDALALWKKGWDESVANVIMAALIHTLKSDDVLRSGRTVKMISIALQALIPLPAVLKGKRDEVFESFEDLLEEANTKNTAFDKNNPSEVNLQIAKDIIEDQKAKLKGVLKMDTTKTTPTKLALVASKSILEVIGELELADQSTLVGVVERLTGLAPSGVATVPAASVLTDEERQTFLDKIVKATATKAELQAVAHAPSPKLQEELLKRLVHRAHASESESSFVDGAKRLFGKYLPETHASGGEFEGELKGLADRLQAENRVLSSVR